MEDCQKAIKTGKIIGKHTTKKETERNRIEQRTTQIFKATPETFQNKEWGKHIPTIIKVTRIRYNLNTGTKIFKDSSEESYYISTTEKLSAKEFGGAIRSHWGIKNKNHYVRDVSMNEDKSRIRINPQNMVKLRSFGLNVMRRNKVRNVSQELFKNGLNLNKLWKYSDLVDL